MPIPTPHKADALNFPGIRHGFFDRRGGVSTGIYQSLNCGPGSGDDLAAVAQNRALAEQALHVPIGGLISLYQHHSAEVVTVTAPWPMGEGPKADGMVTNKSGIALGILAADCGPVLLADAKAGVIAAAHAGWKGAKAGVLANTIRAMEALGARRADTIAALGPTISRSAYEVGPEFEAAFVQDKSENSKYFTAAKRDGHHMFDLPRFITDHLRALNVGTVAAIGLCTYDEDHHLFSYRRATHMGETDYGRNLSAIVLG